MRLPKLSSAVARRASTTAGRSAGRVAASQDKATPCGGLCDPNNNTCGALCPNCLLDPQTNQYTCQK